MIFFKNSIIKLIIAIILVVFLSASIIYFIKNETEKKATQLRQKRSMLEISQKRNENFLELKNNYDLVKKNMPIVKEVLLSKKNIEKFIINLEKIAEETNNNQFLIFDSTKKLNANDKKITGLDFSVNLTGNIDSFLNYLEKLKDLPYFIEIENITIKNGSGIANNESKMNLKSKIYIRK